MPSNIITINGSINRDLRWFSRFVRVYILDVASGQETVSQEQNRGSETALRVA